MIAFAASQATRPVFWHLGTAFEVTWYLLAVTSVVVFAYGVVRPILKYGHGRGGELPSLRTMPSAIWTGGKEMIRHRGLKRRDSVAGWAHQGIFYGFVILFIGTVVLGFQTDFTDPIFGWTYFHGDFYLVYKSVLNVFGTALIVGVLIMMVRRAVIRPAKLDYARPDRTDDEPQYDRRVYRTGDWVFVVSLLVIALTGFLLEGVRIAMEEPGYGGTQFGGWIVAQGLGGVGESGLAAIRHALWWSHGLLALAFVASIPYTKASHMLASFASTAWQDPLAGKRLPIAPSVDAGYGSLADFSQLHLLQLDACTKCGRCHEVCPALATGRPLSPRDVVLELREQANAAMSLSSVGGVLGHLVAREQDPDPFEQPVIGDRGVHESTIWACMQCNACVEACPVGIEQAPIINLMRRRLVDEGELDPGLQSSLELIHKTGNSFGEKRRHRGKWTEGLEFKVKDARKEAVDLLWFVGDFASFDPRSQEVSRTLARLFTQAGLDFGILYDGEQNAGNDVRRVGEEGLFEALAETNISTLGQCEFNRIVTSDPHSLNTLRNEYPEMEGTWEVSHHTELLLELMEAGRLAPPDPLGYRVTYHDPCYLGRHNGGYDQPRRILELLGCELIEMPRNRSNSFCCGAGGGQIWMADQEGEERPSENRIREALGVDSVDYFIVSCPKDVTMYEDAIKTTGSTDRLALREITELLEEALLRSGSVDDGTQVSVPRPNGGSEVGLDAPSLVDSKVKTDRGW